MSFLTTTENGTEDGASVDVDFAFIRICPTVEQDTLVALTCAKDMAIHRIGSDGCLTTRYADSAARHLDRAFSNDIGNLIAAINGAEDVAALDFDKGIAIHSSCSTAPNTGSEGIVAATAAEDFSKEGIAVRALSGTTMRVVFISEDVVHIVVTIAVTKRPGIALVELTSDGINSRFIITSTDCIYCFIPLIFSIGKPLVASRSTRIVSETYLATQNLHMGIAQHQAVFGATIHGGRDNRRAADFQISAVNHTHRDGFGELDGVGFAATTTENPTVVVILRQKRIRHVCLFLDTHYSAFNQYFGQAGTAHTVLGLTHDMWTHHIFLCVIACKGTHRA